MSDPLLSLVMIVKNEAKSLSQTLNSVASVVDVYDLLDTGSTDGTPELAHSLLAERDHRVHTGSFVDFATTRNEAMRLARESNAVFGLMLSGDETLEGGEILRAVLEERRQDAQGGYAVEVRMGAPGEEVVSFQSTRVFKFDSGWRYEGAVHEVLVHERQPVEFIPGVVIRHSMVDRGGESYRQRLARDRLILEQFLTTNQGHLRSWFYLGQTCEELGDWEAARRAYQRRFDGGGWAEEQYEAAYRLGRVNERLRAPWSASQDLYLRAHALRPWRAEPLMRLAEHYYREKAWPLCLLFARAAWELPLPETDRLFVERPLYLWCAADMTSVSASYMAGRQAYVLGRRATLQALAHAPLHHLPRIRENLEQCYAVDA